MPTNSDLASVGFAFDTVYNYAVSGNNVSNDEFLTIKHRNDLGIYGSSVIWPFRSNASLSAIGGLSSTPPISFTRSSSATRVNESGYIEVVGNNVARFDYDPITLKCRGLLIEDQTPNIISKYSASTWGVNTTMTATYGVDNVLSPAGTVTDVAKVSISTAGAGPYGYYANKFISTSWLPNTNYVFSTFVKAGSSSTNTPYTMLNWHGPLAISLGTTNYDFKAIFDLKGLSAAAVGPAINEWGNGQGGVIATNITPAGNNWYRTSMMFRTPSATLPDLNNTQGTYGYRVAVNVNRDINGNSNVNDSLYLWGPQLEWYKGDYFENMYKGPTSYIPTTTTLSATRANDLAFLSGSTYNNFYKNGPGTWVAEFTIPYSLYITYTSPAPHILGSFYLPAGQLLYPTAFLLSNNDGTIHSDNNIGIPGASTSNSIGFGLSAINRAGVSFIPTGTLSGNALCLNAGTVATDTTYFNCTGSIVFGGNGLYTNNNLNGYLRQVEYYNTAVSNTTLQTLTLTSQA